MKKKQNVVRDIFVNIWLRSSNSDMRVLHCNGVGEQCVKAKADEFLHGLDPKEQSKWQGELNQASPHSFSIHSFVNQWIFDDFKLNEAAVYPLEKVTNDQTTNSKFQASFLAAWYLSQL